MKQIVIIHGGSSFNSYENYLNHLKSSQLHYERLLWSQKWRDWLAQEIVDTDVLLPDFPNKQNASYAEWKIYFEKLLPLLGDDVQLVGYSLGAMFLAKYLHESPLSSPVRRLVLVSPCYDDESVEDLGSFRVTSAAGLEKSAKEVIYFTAKMTRSCRLLSLPNFSVICQQLSCIFLKTVIISSSRHSLS